MRRILIILLLSLLSAWNAASAKLHGCDSDDAPKVSLITCGPGKNIYELEGHTALRIQYEGSDVAVNYGLFNFAAPNFVYRFVKGETDYMAGAVPFDYFLMQYKSEGRDVYEQPLNLTCEESRKLLYLLDENLRPENRTYRYNYVKDNCATRPLVMLEKAIGDTLSLKARSYTDGWTFREAMRHYHRNYPWYQFGIDLALGSGIDYVISDREKAFVPMVLMEMVDDSGISDRTLKISDKSGAEEPATPWYLTPLFFAMILLALTVLIAIRDLRRKKVSRWFDAVVFGIYGIVGIIIAFLVFVSEHEATSPNLLILWLNPLCLIVPALIYIKKCRNLVKWYGIVNFASLILLALLWHWFGQSGNIAFYPLIAADAILTLRYLYITICTKQTNRD